MEDSPNVSKFQAAELPISKVTVYTERAEVTRNIGLKLDPGLNRIIIENVARSIIGDSIRVDGEGEATIHEVQFKEERLDQNKVTSPKIEELRAELEVLKAKKEAMDDVNGLLEKQIKAIGDILENFGKTTLVDQQHARMVQFDSSTEQSLEMLYGFHERKSKQLKERARAQRKELTELGEKIGKLNEELRELTRKGAEKNSISVDLDNGGQPGQEVQMVLTYQVHSARWTPSYDVRVEMEQDKQQLKKSIKINYLGMISQSSGENWENVKLALSTVQPYGGCLPKLGTTYAEFYRPPPPPPQAAEYFRTARSFGGSMARKTQDREVKECEGTIISDDEEMGCGLFESPVQNRMAVMKTDADEQFLSTTFTIPQAKTIPEDDSDHKVTIAVLDFECLAHFDCIPSKNTNVFMAAAVINSSAYPLLQGPASIYLNNCFNQQVEMQNVSPGEKFDVPLGVFPSMKVAYKPANKFHHQTGVLSKSSNLVNEQKIVVKNSRPGKIMLTILEPIPKPTDEKIKIRILAPELAHPRHIVQVVNGTSGAKSSRSSSTTTITTNSNGAVESMGAGGSAVEQQLKAPIVGARLNGDNNLEWTILADGGAAGGNEMELVVKWEVEYPPNEKLEFKERQGK